MSMSNRNAQNVVYFNPKKLNLAQEADGASFISLLLCSIGMVMRNKLFVWGAVFMLLSTFCRKKNSTGSSQYLVNLVMIIFAMVTLYMSPPEQQAAAAEAVEAAAASTLVGDGQASTGTGSAGTGQF